MRILFISIAFPPKRDPECLQTAKYFKYMTKNSDFMFDVITSASPTLHMPYDAELVSYSEGYESFTEIIIPENKILNAVYSRVFPSKIERPDSKYVFHKKIVSQLDSLKKPDLIYSRSNPISSTIAALKAKEKFNVPWILHLSDPWLLSPLHKYTGKTAHYHRDLESRCLNMASVVSLTSAETMNLYSEAYPKYKDKFKLFPNVFDPEDISENEEIVFGDKLRILYTGGLIGERNPQCIIDALGLLEEGERDQILLQFVGEADRKSREIFEKCKYRCVQYLGKVSFHSALELQRNSNLLLLLDNPIPDPEKAVYLPSKLLDYFAARKKILAITTLGSATDNVITKYGGKSLSYSDSDGISSYLQESISKFTKKDKSYFESIDIPVEFDAKQNANKLLELFSTYA